ncbi:MAG: metal-dependent hydrolase [Bacteroidetes bacterium]|nr:MAG: metal-dependent hydrolase [Bacteroidota bacterium]
MKLQFFGHACFSVTVNQKILLFDPFVTYNPLAAQISVDAMEADYILISHGHQDHVADAVAVAKRTGATVICAFELMGWFNAQGVDNVHPMNVGGSKAFDFGAVKCVVAHHSSVLPDGTYGANPMGFLITSEHGNFYYSGDTALTLDMQLIPRWSNLNFAVLPIGDNFTMGAADAAVAAQFVQTKTVVGVHYDTFGYITINKDDAKNTFAAKGIELLLPDIGQSIEIS